MFLELDFTEILIASSSNRLGVELVNNEDSNEPPLLKILWRTDEIIVPLSSNAHLICSFEFDNDLATKTEDTLRKHEFGITQT